MRDQQAIEALALELSVVEMALPAHLLFITAQAVVTSGFIMRADALDQLNRAAIVPMMHLKHDPASLQRAAIRVDKSANSMLNMLSADDNLHALYVVCMFNLTLVTERKLDDPDSLAVLTAMMLITELKETGHTEAYSFKEKLLLTEAHRLLVEANRLGLYTVDITPETPRILKA